MSGSPRNLGRPRLQEQTIPTNVRILQIATQAFVQHGYKNVSMDEVAKSCNVTKATIYYYYKTKAELFTAAVNALMKRIRKHSVDILSTEESFDQRLRTLITVFARATVNLDIYNFIKDATPSLSAEQLHSIHQSENDMHDAIEDCFIKEMNKGWCPNGNSKFITHIFLSLLTMSKYRDENGQGFFSTHEQTVDEIMHFFLNGIQSNEISKN